MRPSSTCPIYSTWCTQSTALTSVFWIRPVQKTQLGWLVTLLFQKWPVLLELKSFNNYVSRSVISPLYHCKNKKGFISRDTGSCLSHWLNLILLLITLFTFISTIFCLCKALPVVLSFYNTWQMKTDLIHSLFHNLYILEQDHPYSSSMIFNQLRNMGKK